MTNRYLPPNTGYNDLIFPVVGEDYGIRGSTLLIILAGLVIIGGIGFWLRSRRKRQP